MATSPSAHPIRAQKAFTIQFILFHPCWSGGALWVGVILVRPAALSANQTVCEFCLAKVHPYETYAVILNAH